MIQILLLLLLVKHIAGTFPTNCYYDKLNGNTLQCSATICPPGYEARVENDYNDCPICKMCKKGSYMAFEHSSCDVNMCRNYNDHPRKIYEELTYREHIDIENVSNSICDLNSNPQPPNYYRRYCYARICPINTYIEIDETNPTLDCMRCVECDGGPMWDENGVTITYRAVESQCYLKRCMEWTSYKHVGPIPEAVLLRLAKFAITFTNATTVLTTALTTVITTTSPTTIILPTTVITAPNTVTLGITIPVTPATPITPATAPLTTHNTTNTFISIINTNFPTFYIITSIIILVVILVSLVIIYKKKTTKPVTQNTTNIVPSEELAPLAELAPLYQNDKPTENIYEEIPYDTVQYVNVPPILFTPLIPSAPQLYNFT